MSIYRMRQIECIVCHHRRMERVQTILICDKVYCTECKDFTPFLTILGTEREIPIPAILGDFGND